MATECPQSSSSLIVALCAATTFAGAIGGYLLRTVRTSSCTAEAANGMSITTTLNSPGTTPVPPQREYVHERRDSTDNERHSNGGNAERGERVVVHVVRPPLEPFELPILPSHVMRREMRRPRPISKSMSIPDSHLANMSKYSAPDFDRPVHRESR
jgi:hypothetical protein